MAEIAVVVAHYFRDDLTYVELLEFLRMHHNHKMNLSTLKRLLRRLIYHDHEMSLSTLKTVDT